MYMSFPGIIRSMHFNLKSSYLLDQVKGYLNWFMRNGITKEARLRSRIHLGNHTENHYSWMSYGIPEKLLITDLEGNLRIDYVNIWVEKQRERERRQQRQHPPQREEHLSNPNEAMNENLIDYDHEEEEEEEEEIMPTNKDVLFGRGVPVQTHVGNAKLIELIHGKYAEYTQLTKRDKTLMAWDVVAQIQLDGGRFLERQYDETKKMHIGRWIVASDQKAQRKVALGFRDQKKRIQKSPASLQLQRSKRQKRGCF